MSIKDETRYQYNLTLRRDTRRNWRLKNPVLLSGEIGIEYKDITISDGEETAEFPTASNNQKIVSFKVGNGVDKWNDLPYASGEQGVAGEQGDPLRVDELDTIDRRYLFDDKNKGFSFLAIDEGKIYFKLTNGIGDWTEGFPFGQGIKGEKGEKGTSIESVEFTSTTHESGLPHQLDAIDTYTIIFDNGVTEDFKIQNGTSTAWSADVTPYPISAQVYHNDKQWLALRENSVEPAEGDDWTELVGKQYVDAIIPDLSGYLQPSMTSNAVLNHTDNSIVATGIVTNLGLEVGDVIEIDNDNLQSGYLKPLGQVGSFYQFATNGNDVYVVEHSSKILMKQTNGEGLFEKIEGLPALNWLSICFIGNQMYMAVSGGRIYSVDEATGAVDIVNTTNQNWRNLTTDGTHIYGCVHTSGIIFKVDPIAKTEVAVVPTSPYGDVLGLVYSPIDNSLYIGAGGGAQPIRKLVNMTGEWIDVSTEKRPWSCASYYNGKVYFSDHVGQVWKENDAGDDFELFSKKPSGSPDGWGGNIIVNDMLYKAQDNGDIYTTSIIKKDLFTVESIVSDDEIIVNYAHAFGAGSKSLWYQTLSDAKFTRIAKWYNAPLGLGQAWVDVAASRAISTSYQNTTGKPIEVSVTADCTAEHVYLQVSDDGGIFINVGRYPGLAGVHHVTTTCVVPSNHYYKLGTTSGGTRQSQYGRS